MVTETYLTQKICLIHLLVKYKYLLVYTQIPHVKKGCVLQEVYVEIIKCKYTGSFKSTLRLYLPIGSLFYNLEQNKIH